MRIVTTLDHTGSGRPVIRAKADGKQLSTNYDHGKSHDRNHGEAAGNLLTSGKFDGFLISLTDERMDAATHTTENGARHVFEV